MGTTGWQSWKYALVELEQMDLLRHIKVEVAVNLLSGPLRESSQYSQIRCVIHLYCLKVGQTSATVSESRDYNVPRVSQVVVVDADI